VNEAEGELLKLDEPDTEVPDIDVEVDTLVVFVESHSLCHHNWNSDKALKGAKMLLI